MSVHLACLTLLQRVSRVERTCSTCEMAKPEREFQAKLTKDCAHQRTTCEACVVSWIGSRIEDGEWENIKCCEDCDGTIAIADIPKLLDSFPEIWESFDRCALLSILSGMPNFRYCLAPGCTSGQEHIGTPETHPIFKCQACMVRSCLVHEGPWHEGQTCAEYDEYRTRSGRGNEGQTYAEYDKARTRSERENLASEQAIQLLAKNCPGVKDHTVKRGDTEIQRRGYEKTSWKKCRSCKGIGKTRQAVQKSSRKPVKAPEVRSRFETPGDESDGGEFFNAPEIHNEEFFNTPEIHNEEFFNTPEIHNEEFFNTPEIHSSTPLLQAPKEAKSPARRDCSTCAEEKPIAEYGYKLTRTCIHARGTCQDCVVQWVEAKIEEGEWNTITCPECDSLLEYTDISQILSSTSASFQHYDDLATKACLNSMGEYRHCLSPTCKAGQLHSGGADSPIFVCRSCGHKSCTIHDVPWHEGEICTDYDTRTAHAKQGAADNAASEAEVAKMKACPKCKAPFTKNGGCDHMTCTRCRFEFCHVCLGDYAMIRARGNAFHGEDCRYHTMML
ncbi:hypothetical protein EG328_008741 [Venturia inaequalis]|uniref:RBR-type E3 ubiquitin transferase n=1 Tax=Venturia inaequalis TaxID=5025 RepID=A0A8H3VB75_VENIN|nr:hypothetical protein EG328_008741 [Venturia inaequalis]